MASRRVVVTGLGLITPLGAGVKANWSSLLEGNAAIHKLCDNSYLPLPCRIAASVPINDFNAMIDEMKLTSSELRSLSRATIFALITAAEAVQDAKIFNEPNKHVIDLESVGVAIGSGISDLDEICRTGQALNENLYRRISPWFVPRILTNMSAGYVAMRYGLRGPNHSTSTACTTGLHSIGDSFNFIRSGAAEAMICGGTEACISPVAIAGFCRMRALTTAFNDNPTSASRPFDAQRSGFVIGEGAGIVVLEELEHALRRGCTRIYAEICGYGLSGDAYHAAMPEPNGRGAYLSMSRALNDAWTTAFRKKRRAVDADTDDLIPIGYVNAHATSTPAGDSVELRAIKMALGRQRGDDKEDKRDGLVFVSSNKGSIAHLLGAAGAVEAIFTILSCFHGIVPHTVNLDAVDPAILTICNDSKILLIRNKPRKWDTGNNRDCKRIALCNSFGFGGTNASLCLSEFVSAQILCLHGYRQNADIFRQKTGSFRKLLKHLCEFDFVSAPHTIGSEINDERSFWFTRSADRQFSALDEVDTCDGFDQSVEQIAAYVREQGPFDAMLGFSQGAAMLGLLLALAANGEVKLELKFAVLIAGFCSLSKQHHRLYQTDISLPTLHVYGDNDETIPKRMSEQLMTHFKNASVVNHSGGHFVPTTAPYKQQFVDYFATFITTDDEHQ